MSERSPSLRDALVERFGVNVGTQIVEFLDPDHDEPSLAEARLRQALVDGWRPGRDHAHSKSAMSRRLGVPRRTFDRLLDRIIRKKDGQNRPDAR